MSTGPEPNLGRTDRRDAGTPASGDVQHRDVQRVTGRQRTAGTRLLAIGLVLFLIGLVLVVVVGSGGTSEGIGAAFMLVGSVPGVIGLGLLLASIVERRSDRGAPFA